MYIVKKIRLAEDEIVSLPPAFSYVLLSASSSPFLEIAIGENNADFFTWEKGITLYPDGQPARLRSTLPAAWNDQFVEVGMTVEGVRATDDRRPPTYDIKANGGITYEGQGNAVANVVLDPGTAGVAIEVYFASVWVRGAGTFARFWIKGSIGGFFGQTARAGFESHGVLPFPVVLPPSSLLAIDNINATEYAYQIACFRRPA